MIYIENNLEKQDVFIPRNDGSTCYVSPYDKGYQDGYQDGIEDCGDCPIQQKEVVLTATTETISPDQGYAGMDSVFVDARQLALEKYNEGYHEGEEDGAEEQKDKLASTAFTQNGIYTREDGWSEVEVAVEQTGTTCNLQSKPIVVTADTETIVPDQGYDGFDSVDIDATDYGQGKYDEGYQDGYDKGQEDCPDCPEPNIESGVTFPLNSGFTQTTVTPSSGYDGIGDITIYDNGYGQERYDNGFNQGYAQGQADCPSCPEIESAVTYGIGSGFTGATVTPSSGYDGMAEVTITDNGYGQEKYDEGHDDGYNEGFTDGQTDILSGLTDTTITQNGTYSNPSGWSGVTVAVPQTGSSCNLETKNETLTASTQTFIPSSGYDGMSSVSVDASSFAQDKYDEGHGDGYDEGYQDGLNDCPACPQPSLEAVSYTLPSGFTGTTITPSSGYDGMSSVAITDGGYGQEKYDEGYDDGYQDATGSTCNLQDKTAQMTAATQTFYPDASGVTITGIQTDGYSWFDTGIYPNIDTKIEVSFTPLDRTFIPQTYQKNWGGIIGAQNGDDDNATFQIRFSAATSYILGRVGDGGDVGRFNVTYGTKYTATLDKNAFNLSGSQVPTNATSEDTCNYPIYISAINNGVNHHTWVNHRATPNIFHEVKIWQNNVLVRDYVPAFNNNLPCFFDTVNNTYTYNIGSGTCSTVTGNTGSAYDGMTSITVDASGLCQDYYNSGVTVGENNIVSGMSSTAITQNGNYTNSSGWSAVTVNVPRVNLESGHASLDSGWTSPSTVVPSSGYNGLSSVVVTDDGYGQAKYNQGYQAGHTSGYGEGYADGTSANCNTYSLLYITTDVDTGTINLYPDPTEGTGFSSVAVNLDGYGERRFQDGYREGESSVMKSLFNENDTTYVVGYYYTPTSQVCLITGEHFTRQYDGNLCFSAMSVNGGAWETVQKYLQLPAGWTEIRFQVADTNLYGAFCHRFTPSQTCYMDALKAVSIPSNITDLNDKYTFAYNDGLKILSMSCNRITTMTLYEADNINVLFSHYEGIPSEFSGFPSSGVMFIPTGQTSNYTTVLSNWTHLELF